MAPARIQAITANTDGQPRLTATKEPATPARAMTDPSERSSPPEPITKVGAIASKPIVEVESRLFRQLVSDRDKGDSMASAALSSTSISREPLMLWSRSND